MDFSRYPASAPTLKYGFTARSTAIEDGIVLSAWLRRMITSLSAIAVDSSSSSSHRAKRRFIIMYSCPENTRAASGIARRRTWRFS